MNTVKIFSILISFLFFSCGSKTAMVRKNLDETKGLRDFVKGTKIMSAEIHLADSLYQRAEHSFKEGEVEKAQWEAEYSKAHYQMGLLNQYAKGSEESLAKITKDLEKDKEHLTSLLEVYEEIKTLRKQ